MNVPDGYEIEQRHAMHSGWQPFTGWDECYIYRIKPKAKVKKWRWVANTIGTSHFFITPNHYTDSENVFKDAHIFQLVQKIDSTMIEVDEE